MFKKILRISIIFIVLILFCGMGIIDYFIYSSTKNQIYTDIQNIPYNRIGLLLGTSKYKDKAKKLINEYYQSRIDAAVELFMCGKIDYILVSGDNSTKYYNEPELMKEDLLARGIPLKRIVLDKAGYRTLDSILRCRDIFGQTKFTIISQDFHNQRALFIANHKNLETVAFNANDGEQFVEVNTREQFARIKMVLDLLFNRQATVYGDKIEIN